MPIIHSAIKKLRRDRVRTATNDRVRSQYKRAISDLRKHPSKSKYAAASSFLDRAAKKHVIHKNKASRLKSRLARLVS